MAEKIKESLTPAQAYFIASEKKFLWFCAGRGCFAAGTEIRMADGSIKFIEDVAEGDLVMGDDLTPRYVFETIRGREEMFRVKMEDGSFYDCNKGHDVVVVDIVDDLIKRLPLEDIIGNEKRYRHIKLSKTNPKKLKFSVTSIGDGNFYGFKLDKNNRFISKNGLILANSGKCLAPGTMVKIHSLHGGGLIPVEDVVSGLLLEGPDGNPREVLSTTSGYDEMFEIRPYDKNIKSYTVNKPHILTLLPSKKIKSECRCGYCEPYLRYTSASYAEAVDISVEDILKTEDENLLYYETFQINPSDQSIKRKSEFSIIPKGKGRYFGFELSGDGRFLLEGDTVTHNTRVGSRWIYKNVIRYPLARGMIAANTYNQLHSATLPPVTAYFRQMGLGCVVDKRPPKSWVENAPFIMDNYKNVMTVETGAHIFLRSLDNPEYIRGIEFGWAWIDEISSTDKEAWDIVVGCLRDPYAKNRTIRVTGTPDGDNWTWREFSKKWSQDPAVSQLYDIVFMSSRENPFLPKDFLDIMLGAYDRRKALQEIDGRILIDQEANIYYEWRTKTHKRNLVGYNPDEPLIMCWDFNASDQAPMSMVLCQQHRFNDGTPFIQVIDEFVIYGGNTPKVCNAFIEKYHGVHRGEIYVYGDSTGTNRTLSVGVSDYQMINEYLSPLFPALTIRNRKRNMGEKDRVAAVNAMLLNAKGQVRLFVNPDCTELCLDFDELKPDKFGKINKKDQKRSHTSDALGYYIAAEFPVNFNANESAVSNLSIGFNQRF